jgi:hypothetical protein
MAAAEPIVVTDISNQEFFSKYAQPGRIGLSGGKTLIDKAICRAERHIDPEEKWGSWSHAFVFQGTRHDSHHWVIESDLQIHRKHIQLGVQENRVSKYHDEKLYSTLAVMDFGLTAEQTGQLLGEALELVATHARYSLRELLGTLIALRRPALRTRGNVLARESSMYCSAFVRHLFEKIEIELAPGVAAKNTTPEDIARCLAPHSTWLLIRNESQESRRVRLKRRMAARIARIKAARRQR